jgi:tRNA A37 threonylcarbamoyladenosine dehydratase
MNERIKELAEQATDTVENVNPDTGITHHREFFDKEKFAQLIVQECASMVDLYGRWVLYDKLAVKIKKHFGVEL